MQVKLYTYSGINYFEVSLHHLASCCSFLYRIWYFTDKSIADFYRKQTRLLEGNAFAGVCLWWVGVFGPYPSQGWVSLVPGPFWGGYNWGISGGGYVQDRWGWVSISLDMGWEWGKEIGAQPSTFGTWNLLDHRIWLASG